jgi:hypothetical protein
VHLAVGLSLALLLAPATTLAANTHSTDLERTSDQYWSVANASQTGLDNLANFSVSGWVNVETAPASGEFMSLASFDTVSPFTGGRAFEFYYRNNGGTLQFLTQVFEDVSGVRTDNSYTVNLGTATWKHVVLTFDGSQSAAADKISVYVDKTEIAAAASSNVGGGATRSGNMTDGQFTIGTGAEDPTNTAFDGLRDEVLFYSSTLNQTAVDALFDTPCTPSSTNLVSRWAFDNDGNDSQGSNTLTNNNSATFTTDAPFACAAPAASATPIVGLVSATWLY